MSRLRPKRSPLPIVEPMEERALMSFATYAPAPRPVVKTVLRVGATLPVKSIADAVARATDGMMIQLARGEQFVTPGITLAKSNFILGAWGDATKAKPVLRMEVPPPTKPGVRAGAVIMLKGRDQAIEDITLDCKEDASVAANGVAFKGVNGTVSRCSWTPRLNNLFVSGEGSPAVGTNIFGCVGPSVKSYSVYFAGSGGTTGFEVADNDFGPVETQHAIRVYKAVDGRVVRNVFRGGRPDKSILNVRQADRVDFADNTFIGAALTDKDHKLGGSGAGLGPQASEPGFVVSHVSVTGNTFVALNDFSLFSGCQDIVIADNEIHTVVFNTFTVHRYAGWDAPQATISNNEAFGPGAFLTGDVSRITSTGNTLNTLAVK